MKTKHILTALALPAMFAACTADDIVSVDNGLQQDQRPMLSEDFVLKVNNGIESRYAVEGSTALEFNFEEGDLIGANVIDAYTNRDGKAFDKEDPTTWAIVPYIAPALPFENVGGEWKSAGRVGMGNYLFTNPYNPEDEGRGAAKYELPVVVQYDSENPNAHIEKYNKAVAATVLYKADLNANISLKNLFTYPKIRINFDKSLEVKKVTKIVLQKTNEGKTFIYKGALDNKNIEDMFNPATIEAKIKEFKNDAIADEASYWASKTTSDFIIDTDTEKTWADNSAELKTTPYFVYEMNETVKSNSIEVRFMLPSIADFTNPTLDEEITMVVCTDAGNYQMDMTDVTMYKFKETTLAAVKKNAFARNMSNTLTTLPIDEEYTGALSTDNLVSTAEDWNALVEKYGHLKKYSAEYKEDNLGAGNGYGDAEELVVTIFDDEFALTSDLKMPEVAEFVIKTEVGVEGNVTLKNIKMDGASAILTVKKDATLTTDPTFVAPVVNVEEGGNLKFAAEYDEDEELIAYDGITTVNNEGTVTVPAGVIAQFALNNAKDAVLNVGEAASRAADAKAVANISGTNNGLIVNNGEINVVAALTNNAPSTAAEYEYDEDNVWNGVPTIDNFGTFNAKLLTTNNGLFNNNGVLSSSFVGDSYFWNGTASVTASTTSDPAYTALLKVAKNAKTYIDGNYGVIELSEVNPADFTIHNAKDAEDYGNAYWGTIKYTMNDKSNNTLDLSSSPITYVITNVGINLTKTYTYTDEEGDTQVKSLATLEVNGGEVKIAATTKNADNEDVPVALVSEMIINTGDVLVKDKINSVTKVTVKADATLGIPVGAELSVSTLDNIELKVKADEEEADAKLMINGVLNLRDVNGNADGFMTDSDKAKLSENITLHKNAQITCKVVADVVEETTYEKNDKLYNVLKVLVDAYLENSAEIKNDYATNGQDTWAEITADDVEWSIETEYRTGATWAKKAVTDFVTAYNNLWDDDAEIAATDVIRKDAVGNWTATWSESWRTIIGSYNGTYDGYKASATDKKESKASVLKAVYTNAITAASLKAEIKAVMGNEWVGETVYVKEFNTQAITDIKSADESKVVMTTAYKTAVSEALDDVDLVAKMSNIGYLTWKKFINNELDDATTKFAYETEIVKSDYIDASSYIEFWEGSDLYKDMKLWKDLSDAYGNTTNFVKYQAGNLTKENMYQAFAAIYVAAQADSADPLFKIDPLVTQITTDKLSATKALKWTNEQLEKMAEKNDAYLVDINAEPAQSGSN